MSNIKKPEDYGYTSKQVLWYKCLFASFFISLITHVTLAYKITAAITMTAIISTVAIRVYLYRRGYKQMAKNWPAGSVRFISYRKFHDSTHGFMCPRTLTIPRDKEGAVLLDVTRTDDDTTWVLAKDPFTDREIADWIAIG